MTLGQLLEVTNNRYVLRFDDEEGFRFQSDVLYPLTTKVEKYLDCVVKQVDIKEVDSFIVIYITIKVKL